MLDYTVQKREQEKRVVLKSIAVCAAVSGCNESENCQASTSRRRAELAAVLTCTALLQITAIRRIPGSYAATDSQLTLEKLEDQGVMDCPKYAFVYYVKFTGDLQVGTRNCC